MYVLQHCKNPATTAEGHRGLRRWQRCPRTGLRSQRGMIDSRRFGAGEFARGKLTFFRATLPGGKVPSRGGLRYMGLILLLVIWLITFASAYFFIAKTWWLPTGASAAAAGIDHHFAVTFVLMGIVFVAAQLILGFLAWKYREQKNSRPARYMHGNNTMEVTWTILTFILFVGLNWASEPIWGSERFRAADSRAVQVEVTGMQFQWYFRYPGPDGKFGATKPELVDPSAGGEGAVGLDTTDPASKDDIVTGTMYVPVNREVEVILRAHDVIHSFFVPAMRFKQDAVPGLAIRMHFTPISTGDYEIACAELCGLGHYKMHGMLRVVSQDEFDKWMAAREAEKQ